MKYEVNLKNEFYLYVGNAVDYYKRKHGSTNKDLAIYMNVSESFIKRANLGEKQYNSLHLWKLANYLQVNINKLVPPSNDFEEYQRIRPSATIQEYKKFINLMKS